MRARAKNPAGNAGRSSMLTAALLAVVLSGISGLQAVTARRLSGDDRPDAASRAAEFREPEALAVHPEQVTLSDRWSVAQLTVRGRLASGNAAGPVDADYTRLVVWTSDTPSIAAVSATGLVTPVADGQATVVARYGNHEARVPVTVSGVGELRPVSFHYEVLQVLDKAGCNGGRCHGTPTGKNGFHLSLRGYDPVVDYTNLTREAFSRRADPIDPARSLMLLKPLGELPHGGGTRFTRDDLTYRLLEAWITEGRPNDPPEAAQFVQLEVQPEHRVLRPPLRGVQLRAIAHFSDGTSRDVTPLVVFESSNDLLAEVDGSGYATGIARGEAAILCRYLHEIRSVRLTVLDEVPDFVFQRPPENNFIDTHVFAQLEQLQMQPSELCSDEEFIRRAYLDVLGVLPTPDEVREFLADSADSADSSGTGVSPVEQAERRARLIDRLLQRPEYADFWTLHWADILQLNEDILGRESVRRYHAWLREQIVADRGLDELARELLVAEGSALENPPANFYRVLGDPEGAGETVAQMFMGVRLQCARCHNHPQESWTQDDYYAFAAVFAQVEREEEGQTIRLDPSGQVEQPRTGQIMAPILLGEGTISISDGTDPRAVLADWLAEPDNPFFARVMVNRIWYHLMGRGIVEPLDDFRDSNPPANGPLLEALARDFVAHGYSQRHAIRTIMNSRVYQLSSRANESNRDDVVHFSHAQLRLLAAEQLLDAVSSATGVPTRFDEYPDAERAVQLPGAEVEQQFLMVFGRPPRNIACECERESSPSLSQALAMISGRLVHRKLTHDSGRIAQLAASDRPNAEVLDEVFLAFLSRLPGENERAVFLAHLEQSEDRRAALEDVGWALLNSKEFLFRH